MNMNSDVAFLGKLSEYFDTLDRTEISNSGLFQSEHDKERYETMLTFGVQKYKAAVYHYRNVIALLETDEERMKTVFSNQDDGKISKLSFYGNENCYAYELSAFLEALKSAVDFIAIACSQHLPNIQLDSVGTLIRIVKRSSKTGPIFDEIRRNLEWLERLRSYRHHIVHRRTISTSIGYEMRIIAGVCKTCMHPVIIPEFVPSNVLDTRKTRLMEESSFDISEIKSYDNKGKVIDYSFKYRPPKGFVLIQDFMKSNLESFEIFFKEIIDRLTSLNFGIA